MNGTKSRDTGPSGAGEKTIASNRQAFHEYFVEDRIEAGIALTGTEIKSLRAGQLNLREAYARIDGGEAWLIGLYISPYKHAGDYFQHAPDRPRKLLLHKREITYLAAQLGQKGLTLVPLRLYLKRGRAKLELGVAKGKKLFDKRQSMAERDARRDVERTLRGRD